jgi:death-on-curing protein
VGTRYLDVEDLLRIIELEDIGPVRDLGLLDSAAARPRSLGSAADLA